MFEELFKYVDWRHSSLLSESILQKGFIVYDFWSFCVKYLFFHSLFLVFSCLCVVITSSSRKKKSNPQILIITVWKSHRSLEDHCIIQINHSGTFLKLEVV